MTRGVEVQWREGDTVDGFVPRVYIYCIGAAAMLPFISTTYIYT